MKMPHMAGRGRLFEYVLDWSLKIVIQAYLYSDISGWETDKCGNLL